MSTADYERHLLHVARMTRAGIVAHIELEHGGIPDWEAPWAHHRKIHWRDEEKTTVQHSEGQK